MRALACFGVVLIALGCSNNDFEVTPSEDSGIFGDDTSVRDAQGTPDTAAPADALPGEVEPVPADGGKPCTTIDDCDPGQYCQRPSCGVTAGFCAPYMMANGFDPVCGCDGVTYWNKTYAFTTDAIVKHGGRCSATEGAACLGTSCGGLPDSICVRQVAGSTACASMIEQGVCWRLPLTHECGGTTLGGTVENCEGKCMTFCNAVLGDKAFYPKACTPG
jgi:hypothetical protein